MFTPLSGMHDVTARQPATGLLPARRRVALAFTPGMLDFQHAVKQVLGQDLDLRGPAAPAGGWLSVSLPVPGGAPAFGLWAGGAQFFTVTPNDKARTDWQNAAWIYENIDQEVFSGKFGLIDLHRLHAAAAAASTWTGQLESLIDETQRMTDRTQAGALAGSAASVIVDRLRGLTGSLTAARDVFTEPAPLVHDVLDDAAKALTEFGHQMSYIWWESNQVLLGVPDNEIVAIRNNIDSYLAMNGLSGLGEIVATLQPPPDPAQGAGQPDPAQPDPAAIGNIKDVLARYDSTVAGDLLPGMDKIAGDLAQQPVWDAANAAITNRINVELDKLDRVARSETGKLAHAYNRVVDRLAKLPRTWHAFRPGLSREWVRAAPAS